MGKRTQPNFHYLVGAVLVVGTTVVGSLLTKSLTGQQSLWSILVCAALGIVVTFFYLRWQARSAAESPEAIDRQIEELAPKLRESVRSRSYGARGDLIADDLKKLDLGTTPRVGWVQDPTRNKEPEPLSEGANIVSAFASSRRRLLIVGEPGSGKTMAAYALIEHLDETEGDERTPLLINLSAWEDQDSFENFLFDYLRSPVGYEVSQHAVARKFVEDRRYSLILDGLDEIPAGLREHFSECLDDFMRGLPNEVAVIVTCRSQEYEKLKADYRTGLGLVQAVEVLPLTGQQLDEAFVELAEKRGEDWKKIRLTRRQLVAYRLVRHLLSNPLFLNLAVEGNLNPRELLNCDEVQELQELVFERYLDLTLTDQSQYNPADARGHLTWIARFLNGVEVSPFGLKTTDATVFDLASLTPPEPPRGYRLVGGLIFGLIYGLIVGLIVGLIYGLIFGLIFGLIYGLIYGLVSGLVWELFGALPSKWNQKRSRSALSSRLTFVWPLARQRRSDFLRRAGWGWLGGGLIWGLILGPSLGLIDGLIYGLIYGLIVGLIVGLIWGLVETRPVLITSRTLTEARSRSLISALVVGLIGVLGGALLLSFGPVVGLVGGLNNGGWFVLLQKVAHRRLARAGKLPSRPGAFLEWGIERQIFRQVGGGVRFRHDLIQQHLASAPEAMPQ